MKVPFLYCARVFAIYLVIKAFTYRVVFKDNIFFQLYYYLPVIYFKRFVKKYEGYNFVKTATY